MESATSGVRVRSFTPADAGRWDAFVLAHPDGTFFHRAGWSEVLERAFGHRTRYLLAEQGGEIAGVLPLAEVKSALFGHALISTPFCVYGGPVASNPEARRALEERACEMVDELGASSLELRNRQRTREDWPAKELYVTFRRPISADADANLKAIPRKQRAMVRKGIERELDSTIDQDAKRFYALYSESLRNLGTPVFGKRYVDLLREVFGDACEIVTVSHKGAAAASVMCFYFRDEVLPYYGGGGTLARSLAANDFMYWEVMRRAAARGSRIYDYGRSKRGTGSFDFKSHWGFEPSQLYYEYYLPRGRAMPNLSPTNPKYELMIRLWRRLPLWVTRWIGPLLARSLG